MEEYRFAKIKIPVRYQNRRSFKLLPIRLKLTMRNNLYQLLFISPYTFLIGIVIYLILSNPEYREITIKFEKASRNFEDETNKNNNEIKVGNGNLFMTDNDQSQHQLNRLQNQFQLPDEDIKPVPDETQKPQVIRSNFDVRPDLGPPDDNIAPQLAQDSGQETLDSDEVPDYHMSKILIGSLNPELYKRNGNLRGSSHFKPNSDLKLNEYKKNGVPRGHVQGQPLLLRSAQQRLEDQQQLANNPAIVYKNGRALTHRNDPSLTYRDQFANSTVNHEQVEFDPKTLSAKDREIYAEKLTKILNKRQDFIANNERYKQAKYEMWKHNLPKMIVIGAKKCGTGALAKTLAMHPLVQYGGESFYFLRHLKEGIDWYRESMALSRDSDIAFEKTPIYLYSHSILDKIYEVFGDEVKIINIMCDPVRRIYSDFLHLYRFNQSQATMDVFDALVTSGIEDINRRKNRINLGITDWEKMWKLEDVSFTMKGHSFEKTILKSAYSIYLKEWYKKFPKYVNFLNLDGSDLYSNPGKIFVDVQKFLNLPIVIDEDNFFYNEEIGLYCRFDFEGKPICPSSTKGRSRSSSQDVPESIKQKLRDVMEPFTKELEVLENRDFSHWDW